MFCIFRLRLTTVETNKPKKWDYYYYYYYYYYYSFFLKNIMNREKIGFGSIQKRRASFN